MADAKRLFNLEQVSRLVVTVFLIGAAWARIEYKMDEMNTATKTLLEKYVIANDYDKKILGYQIEQLRAQVEINTTTIKAITEFIKPEEVRRKSYSR